MGEGPARLLQPGCGPSTLQRTLGTSSLPRPHETLTTVVYGGARVSGPRRNVLVATAAVVVAVLAAAAVWAVARSSPPPPAGPSAVVARIRVGDVPQQLALIQSQLRPGDVVLVSAFASFQYAYYAPDRPTFVATPPRWAAVPFTVTYPGREDLVVVGGLNDAAIRRALADTAGRATRIWVVLGHSEPGREEEARWDAATRSIGRVTKVRTGIVERFGPRRAELERPWLVEVGRREGPG